MVKKFTNLVFKNNLTKLGISFKKRMRRNQLLDLLKNQKVSNLKKTLKNLGIKGYSKLNKKQLQGEFDKLKNKYKTKSQIKAELKKKKEQVELVKKTRKEQRNKLINNLIKMNDGKINEYKLISKNYDLLKLKQILQLIKSKLDKRAILGVNNTFITLSNTTLEDLFAIIDEEQVEHIQVANAGFSDAEFIAKFKKIKEMTISLVKDKLLKNGKVKTKNGGAFFKYLHNLSLDLEQYGLFHEFDTKNYKCNCLIRGIMNSKLENKNEIVDALKFKIKNREIPVCKLKKICEEFGFCMKIRKIRDENRRTYKYGKGEVVEFGLIDNHYFIINKDAEITSYALKNYNALIGEFGDINKFRNITKKIKGKYKRENGRYLDSFKIIKFLIENKDKHLKLIEEDDLYKTQYYGDIEEIRELNYDEKNDTRDYAETWEEKSEKKKAFKQKNENPVVVFFDFETYT